jgi:hypothetical protein
MLRHIMSVGLVMTACAAFIPIEAHAATLTITPIGEIPRSPGDSITFYLTVAPSSPSLVTIRGFLLGRDSSELSSSTDGNLPVSSMQINTQVTFSTVHTVLTPVKDGMRDLWATLLYDQNGRSGTFTNLQVSASAGDVVPVAAVPEPLTMFGTALGLGCGVLFKRKFSKKTEF